MVRTLLLDNCRWFASDHALTLVRAQLRNDCRCVVSDYGLVAIEGGIGAYTLATFWV